MEEEINEEDESITFVTIDDVPIINKRKKQKKRYIHHKKRKKNKNTILNNNKYGKEKNSSKNKRNVDLDDETRFNSEEYHKKQHDL